MPTKLNFFTPIQFRDDHKRTTSERLLELADDFIFPLSSVLGFGHHKAQVLSVNQKELEIRLLNKPSSKPSSWTSTLVKVALYFTIVLPVLAIAIKMYRWTYTYKVEAIDPSAVDTLGLDLSEILTVDKDDIYREYETVDGEGKILRLMNRNIPQKPFTLRRAALDVIEKINMRLSPGDTSKLTQEQQKFYEGKNFLPAVPWNYKHRNGSNLCFYERTNKSIYPEKEKEWMIRILEALVEKKYIQSFEYARCDGYLIEI